MGFYDTYCTYTKLDIEGFLSCATEDDVRRVLDKDRLGAMDYLTLLSPAAEKLLEDMAKRANRLTIQQFGKVMLLFTPIYLGDYCVNQCIYCSFNASHKFTRRRLTIDELEREAEEIARTGLKHILILTGESRQYTPVSYIKECVCLLKKYFTSISIEIYPLEMDEYRMLVDVGVDGLTIYQEVYNESVYKKVHPHGPKKDYHYRLDAPERGCIAGMRTVSVGALLGLDNWRREAFFACMHADYLQNKYGDIEVSVSLPRLQSHIGDYIPASPVNDRGFVQVMLAARLFLPRAGITISTREQAAFRDHIIPLGVTRMSAGVSTMVGGHTEGNSGTNQFEIADHRSVQEIRSMLLKKGYQPIFKDWH